MMGFCYQNKIFSSLCQKNVLLKESKIVNKGIFFIYLFLNDQSSCHNYLNYLYNKTIFLPQ